MAVILLLAGVALETVASDAEGARLYNEVCATCHETGMPKAPSRPMLGFMSSGTIHHALTEGIMRVQAQQLSPEQKVAVVEFLTGRKPSLGEQASPPACQGEAELFDPQRPPALAGASITITAGRTRVRLLA